MLDYTNLSDVEFEELCKDILNRKLGLELRAFSEGKDKGIDLTDSLYPLQNLVQVKHYKKSSVSDLIKSLKKEVDKVANLQPKSYFVCTSLALTHNKISEIYSMFSDYMSGIENIFTINEIEDFLKTSENVDILRKHYKLWIQNSGILAELTNNSVFVDCEAFLYNVNELQKLFVRTEIFEHSIKLLQNYKTLMITGDPGVGKTTTCQMLALQLATEGFTIRYTTDVNNLSDLKKSLARNPLQKEVVIIDDCFGQAYFQIKSTQSREIASLIKYVNLSCNKYLILNSRVTILREAKCMDEELSKIFDNNDLKVQIIDMNKVGLLDKGRILYNHLYFNELPLQYFNEAIRKNRNYIRIVRHENYNPRIIEYVSRKNFYEAISPKEYYDAIISSLDNPTKIWDDEYEKKLQKVDRILLTTLFSFSDKSVPLEIVKRQFINRIQHEKDIDKTNDPFKQSLNRLTNNFFVIIDEYGVKKLKMSNPSINDYLASRISNNIIEKEFILENSNSVAQHKRLLNGIEFNQWMVSSMLSHKMKELNYDFAPNQSILVALYVTDYGILDECYKQDIEKFILNDGIGQMDDCWQLETSEIAWKLLNRDIFEFYGIKDLLRKRFFLECYLKKFDLQELCHIIKSLSIRYSKDDKENLENIAIEVVNNAIADYCSSITDFDYYVNDLNEIINQSIEVDECGSHICEDTMCDLVAKELERNLLNEIEDFVIDLPSHISINVQTDDILYYVSGIREYVHNVIREVVCPDEFEKKVSYTNPYEEIDCIFKKGIYETKI